MSDLIAAWRIPVGKLPKDVFNPRNPALKGNMGGFPKLPQHKSLLSMDLCVSYQAFSCPWGIDCLFAHVAANNMPVMERQKVNVQFMEIYSSLWSQERQEWGDITVNLFKAKKSDFSALAKLSSRSQTSMYSGEDSQGLCRHFVPQGAVTKFQTIQLEPTRIGGNLEGANPHTLTPAFRMSIFKEVLGAQGQEKKFSQESLLKNPIRPPS